MQATATAQTAEIHLYGIIGEGMHDEKAFSKTFVQAFKNLEATADTIHLHINSPGGSVWAGLPILNTIRASKKVVHTYVDGIAYSMAAMIALAGQRVHMARGSMLMLHNVSGMAVGNAETIRQTADTMAKYDALFADLISRKTGQPMDFVKANWLNFQDNYFSPEEAQTAGLIDEIEAYQARNMPSNPKSLNREQLIAFFQEHPLKNNLSPMNTFKKWIPIGFLKNEDEPEIVADEKSPAETATTDLQQENEQLKADLKTLQQENEALKASTDDLKAQLNAVATPPSTPLASADVIDHTTSKPSFETTFDREIQQLRNNQSFSNQKQNRS